MKITKILLLIAITCISLVMLILLSLFWIQPNEIIIKIIGSLLSIGFITAIAPIFISIIKEL